MSNTPLRLGVIGPGVIFRRILSDLGRATGLKLTAIGSRDLERAQQVAADCGAEFAYGSYQELAQSPHVDVVYIATPHNFHMEEALMCMEAGKHVICEKPMALNVDQTRAMIDCAKKNNVFLMEAMWSRCFPASAKLRELLADKAIGEAWHFTADFSFSTQFDPNSRLFSKDLAGGALLDVGIYPMSMAVMAMGADVESFWGNCVMAPSGVDQMSELIFKYKTGATAHMYCGTCAISPQTMHILGSEGRIEVPNFWHPEQIIIYDKRNHQTDDLQFPKENEGHWHQFQHVADCINQGIIDSPIMPLSETLMMSRIMTELRQQFGIQYPEEEA